ncbi:MAG: hypothetical protein AAF658_08905, partial [Myxococcota bacterium]
GFAAGSTVRVCSTVAAPAGSLGDCSLGTAETGENVGGGSTSESGLRGVIVAQGVTSGLFEAGASFFPSVALSEGEQWIHFEVEEPDLEPQVASRFFRFDVDSVGPNVTAIALNENVAGNDPPTQIALSGSEGMVSGNTLQTSVTVTVSDALEGSQVQLFNDGGAEVGNGILSGGTVTFVASLPAGIQTLTARAVDAAGNFNDPMTDTAQPVSVLVDFQAPSVVLPEPTLLVYSDLNGEPGVSPSRANVPVLQFDPGVAVSLQVSDDVDLSGGSLTLEAFADSGFSGAPLESTTFDLSSSPSVVSAASFPFSEGENFLRATLTDTVGNSTVVSTTAAYVTDFLGPILSLEFRDSMNMPVACPDFDNQCAVTTAASPMGTRAWLDVAANDLFYSVSECVSTPALGVETCNTTARLESRIVTSSGDASQPFSPVSEGIVSVDADVALTSFTTRAVNEGQTPLFDAGAVREVRLVAIDTNGNRSESNSLFLTLGIDGQIISVERVVAGGDNEVIEDDLLFGSADNVTMAPGEFRLNLLVKVTPVTSVAPTSVTLINVPTGFSVPNESAALPMMPDMDGVYSVEIPLVRLSTVQGSDENPTALQISVDCGATVGCGDRSYANLRADIDAPSFQFDRCSLCNFNVPFTSDTCATSCDTLNASAGANIQDPSVATATWNAALDKNADPSDGFSTTSAADGQLRVLITDVQQAPLVRLTSSQASLPGSEVLASSCDFSSSVGVCTAVFSNLSVPTLANGLVHDLTVSFVDRAGNAAEIDPLREDGLADEVLF